MGMQGLHCEVVEEDAARTFTSLYKSFRAKLKLFCKFEKWLSEYLISCSGQAVTLTRLRILCEMLNLDVAWELLLED